MKHFDLSIQDMELQGIAAANERAQDGGIWSRSSGRSYVIFCVGQRPQEIKRFMRWALSNSLGFKPLHGCYKGALERSFIVNLNDMPKIARFIADQESVLILSDYNRADVPKATLFYLKTGKRESLGLFCQGTAKVKDHFESWTFDPMTGNYYVTSA